MLLAIDTATRTASVALYDETGVVGEATWRARENHTTSLMPELIRLMRVSGVTTDDLYAVAVATGPGSFTGLRIGLSLAKGLALARGMSLIGIPTLDGMAQAFAQQTRLIWTVLEIGRGRYAAAPYRSHQTYIERVGDYVVGDAECLATNIAAQAEPVLVCGEVNAQLNSLLLARLPEQIALANPAGNLRRAAYLAELAWQRWETHQQSDLDTLTPYYVSTASLPQATGS